MGGGVSDRMKNHLPISHCVKVLITWAVFETRTVIPDTARGGGRGRGGRSEGWGEGIVRGRVE